MFVFFKDMICIIVVCNVSIGVMNVLLIIFILNVMLLLNILNIGNIGEFIIYEIKGLYNLL